MTLALEELPDAFLLGKVEYIDYTNEVYRNQRRGDVNTVIQAYHKRRFFGSENEFRVVMNPFADTALAAEAGNDRGFAVEVDLNQLVSRIRVYTGAATWFTKLVESVMERYGMKKEVVLSEI